MENFQNSILEQVLGHFNSRSEAVDKLSVTLGVGKDAIYRRLRGDTYLTPAEIKILAEKYNLSLDALVSSDSNEFLFSFSAISQKITAYEDYLEGVLENMNMVNKLSGVQIKYATAEIPVFYYCMYPELISFKMYVWSKSIWGLEFAQNHPFRFDLMSPRAKDLTAEIVAKYLNIDSTELWSLNIMDNSLNQIEYLLESGEFEEENDALVLCDKYLDLTKHMRLMAEKNKKFGFNADPEGIKTKFHLYHNEMIYTNNMILINSDVLDLSFSTFESPNFLTCVDQRICHHVDQWFDKIVSKSNPMNFSTRKSLNAFFNRIEKKILATKSRIEMFIEK